LLGGVVSVKDYLEEVDEMSTFMETTKKHVLEQIASEDKEDSELRISRLQWSIDGGLYHMQRMIDVYMIIFREVETRVFSIQEQQKVVPDMLLMYNQDMPHLYHEMYAFANMYRISLDYFPKVLHHKFTNKRNFPKSISSFKSKTTDCSTMERLAQDQFVAYFKDLRDFINHDRSFAIGQNAIIRKDDVDESQVDDVVEHGIWTMLLNGVYRIDGKIDWFSTFTSQTSYMKMNFIESCKNSLTAKKSIYLPIPCAQQDN